MALRCVAVRSSDPEGPGTGRKAENAGKPFGPLLDGDRASFESATVFDVPRYIDLWRLAFKPENPDKAGFEAICGAWLVLISVTLELKEI